MRADRMFNIWDFIDPVEVPNAQAERISRLTESQQLDLLEILHQKGASCLRTH